VAKIIEITNRPLRYPAAMRRIRELYVEGKVTWTQHAELRMRQRGLLPPEIDWIIAHGQVVEHSRPSDAWRYKVRGETGERRRLACIIELRGNLAKLITVMVLRQ
jgi:1,6-anhydro-N-acetylmuramate kinase